jgi:hypothetical protein
LKSSRAYPNWPVALKEEQIEEQGAEENFGFKRDEVTGWEKTA